MGRESFIFYRSFYEAISCMSDKVQAQLYSAIAEYALDSIEPKDLCKEAQGMFMLIRPILDANNARYKNGTKGAMYGKLGGRPRKKPTENKTSVSITPYSLSFAEEAEKMKHDEIWLEAVCMQFHISKEEANSRLDRFPQHCNTECADKPHSDYGDAQRHFCSWMRKAYKPIDPSANDNQSIPPPDYTYNGGFGGIYV